MAGLVGLWVEGWVGGYMSAGALDNLVGGFIGKMPINPAFMFTGVKVLRVKY